MKFDGSLFSQAIETLEKIDGCNGPITFELTTTKAMGGRSWTVLEGEGSQVAKIMFGPGSRLAAGEDRYAAETIDELQTIAQFLVSNPEILTVGLPTTDDAITQEYELYEDDPDDEPED